MESGEARGCRERGGGRVSGAETEGDAVKVALVVGEVRGAESGEIFSGGAREVVVGGSGGGVVAAVGEGADIRDGGEEEDDLGGVADLERGGGGGELAAGQECAEAGGVAHAGGGAVGGIFSVEELAGHEEAVGALGGRGETCGAIEGDVEIECAGLVGGEADDDDIVGGADEHFAGVGDFAETVGDTRDGGGEVEFAAVVGGRRNERIGIFDFRLGGRGRCGVMKFQAKITEGLVGTVGGVGAATAGGTEAGAGEVLVYEGLGLDVFSCEEEATNFGERPEGCGAVGVLRRAGPHAGFVEDDAFFGDAAEDHGAEATVAERSRFREVGGGFVVPDELLGGGAEREYGEKREREWDDRRLQRVAAKERRKHVEAGARGADNRRLGNRRSVNSPPLWSRRGGGRRRRGEGGSQGRP